MANSYVISSVKPPSNNPDFQPNLLCHSCEDWTLKLAKHALRPTAHRPSFELYFSGLLAQKRNKYVRTGAEIRFRTHGFKRLRSYRVVVVLVLGWFPTTRNKVTISAVLATSSAFLSDLLLKPAERRRQPVFGDLGPPHNMTELQLNIPRSLSMPEAHRVGPRNTVKYGVNIRYVCVQPWRNELIKPTGVYLELSAVRMR
ncbi:hypothetical protein B0H13DRAFT_1858272 [Mycena leptocephala]|nr:hypothetical protein B0H13DRAFT_1858272 [Mycena leptocephala]